MEATDEEDRTSQSSSLSIKDQDDTDLPPTAGEDVPAQQTETGTTERLPDQPELHPHSLPAGLATPPRPPRKPTRVRTETHFQPLQRRLASQGSLDTLRPHSPWMQPDPYSGPEDQDKEYVGFATLPNQVNRKNAKKGFTFTLMVAGESGLGKSTMINSLFLTDLYTDRRVPNAEERIIQTVNVIKYTVGIEEKGVRLHLNIIDTPGFGDAVNNTETWAEVEDYIDQQFEQYFRQESGLNRRNIQDNRVHCCLYFISPFGHGLRPLDVECMRALHGKVNIVPVLAKADSLTPAEVCRKKLKIKEEILKFGINIYQFPDCDSDEEEELKQQDQMLKDSIPFAVIGSNIQVESKGRRFRGRLYPWGVAEVENPEHSDFLLLRNTLIRTHMQDLKDVTQESHYENYRAQCIQSMTRLVVQERRRSLCDKLQQENRAGTPVRLAVIYGEKEKLVLEEIDELHSQRAPLHAKSLTHSPTPVSPSTSPSSPSSSSSSLAEENVLEEVPERIPEETQRNQRGDERNKRERRRGDRGRVL